MVNLNNMVKIFGFITLCSVLLLTVLAFTVGFLDNKAVIDTIELIMKGCLVTTGIGTLGLIAVVIHYECYYGEDACCGRQIIDTTALLAPTVVVTNANISMVSDLPKQENVLVENTAERQNRFYCC